MIFELLFCINSSDRLSAVFTGQFIVQTELPGIVNLSFIYRSFNSIFGKIGRIASEDVVLELVNKQSLPVLLYALEVCSISKSDFKALDYVVDSVFFKVFNTFNKETVFECREMFNFAPVSEIISRRAHSFTLKYSANETCNKLFEAVKLVS